MKSKEQQAVDCINQFALAIKRNNGELKEQPAIKIANHHSQGNNYFYLCVRAGLFKRVGRANYRAMKTEYTFEDVNAVRVYTRKYAKSVPSYKTVYKNTELHKPKVKLDVKVKEFSLLWGLIKFNY
jgi:hypothetical protein